MRCAIYTRKSSTEGLQQDFNSIDAQRESCAAYVASQRLEGWLTIDRTYDDGGYSGGSLERPALQRLLVDLDAGLFDTIVVQKIDRLSRSLFDFVSLVGLFEKKNVTFVAVTQSFNTTTSMGRLTLNILLSFAQFERELTGERIREKFATMRSKGMRPSGGRPFGYQVKGHALIVDDAEAAVVARIFATFIRLGSSATIAGKLNRAGLLNHKGQPFNLSFIRRVLKNRLYCGDLVHRGQPTAGSHQPIVSEQMWAEAQAVRAPHEARWAKRKPQVRGLLTGLLFGPTGALHHESGMSKGRLYRYYGHPRQQGTHRNGRFRASQLEQSVLAAVDPEARLVRDPTSENAAYLINSLVDRIEIADKIIIRLKTGGTIEAVETHATSTPSCKGLPKALERPTRLAASPFATRRCRPATTTNISRREPSAS